MAETIPETIDIRNADSHHATIYDALDGRGNTSCIVPQHWESPVGVKVKSQEDHDLGRCGWPVAEEELVKGAGLIVHEATIAHLPGMDDMAKAEDARESAEGRDKSRGNPKPQMSEGLHLGPSHSPFPSRYSAVRAISRH